MAVFRTAFPDGGTRNRIQHGRRRAAREGRARQRDHALEHQREIHFLVGAGRAHRNHPRDVGRAAQVLAARINQQQAIAFDSGVRFRRGAVMRHGAIGIETGDGGEAGADVGRAACAGGGDLLIYRQFGNRFLALRAFEPREEFTERRAVLRHCLPHMGQFGIGLARLQQGGRVDRFNARHRRVHGVKHTAGHARRINQQLLVNLQRSQGVRGLRIRGHFDAIGGQRGAQCVVDLAVRHEQRGVVQADQRMANEHRVVIHVRAAQVQQPRNVVHRANEMHVGTVRAHGVSHLRQLVGAGHAGLGRDVFIDLRVGQAGAVGPDVVQQVRADFQRGAGRGGSGRQGAERPQAQHLTIDADDVARAGIGGQPVDMARRGRQRDLHQLHARASQLRLGLHPIAAVHPQAGEIGRDDKGSHRPREARQPAPSLPARRQIFGQVRVRGRNDIGGQAAAAHGLPQLGNTGVGARHGGWDP